MKTTIIVPVYNDNKQAIQILKEILLASTNNIIVVDDGSTDFSGRDILNEFKSEPRIQVVNHTKNKGKGAAMRTGIEKAWELGAQAAIFIDSDGQHDPAMLPTFEKALQENELVFGYREITNKMPLLRRAFNILIQLTVKMLFGIKKRDLLCGYLGISKKIYNKVRWTSNSYGIETEISTKVGKKNLSFKEIRIETVYLGKKHGVSWVDGIKILAHIPFWYFQK